jgi:leader peptidase (prepilin peptidase) / N-methyltransferase
VSAIVVAGVLGAAIGSFLNVCVFRWPRGESVVTPRSHCPACDAAIAWYDNIPILSYLLLRGRCRHCGARISPQYVIVEAATALVWAASAASLGLSFEALRGAVFLTLLLGISLADARHYIIPDQFSLGGLALGLLMAWAPGGISALPSAEGAVLGFAVLWLVGRFGEWLFRKPAMGAGDIKMLGMVGAFVGPIGVVLTLFLGALSGTVIFGPISWKTRKLVPFGIFLALGAAVTYVWGGALVDWYVQNVLHG